MRFITSAARTCAAAGALIAICSLAVRAQVVPDLTGTWTLDAARSDPAAAQAGGRGRGGLPPNQISITQTAADLTIVRGNQAFVYALDGSETPGPPGGETKSTVAWQNGSLIVTWKREYFGGAQLGYVTSTGRDTYALTGTVLTVERVSTAPRTGQQTVRFVYNKAS